MAKKRSQHISILGSRITSVVSVALVLVLLGVAALMTSAARKATDNVRRNMGFTIKMERGMGADEINNMKKRLAKAAYVESFVYASPDEILAQESEIIGEDIMALVDENPYGAEFDVKVRPQWAHSDSIASIALSVGSAKGVEDVLTDTGVIDSVNRNISRLTWIMLAVAAALLAISFVLINNTVSLAVYSRRFVIHTMRLVGATGAFIRRPFLKAGGHRPRSINSRIGRTCSGTGICNAQRCRIGRSARLAYKRHSVRAVGSHRHHHMPFGFGIRHQPLSALRRR